MMRSRPQTEPEGARVWVHIADVSAHVRPRTALGTETARRATSVYVPGTVEPMLPEALSNQACSLVPGEERLAVTIEIADRGPRGGLGVLLPVPGPLGQAPDLRRGRPALRARGGEGAAPWGEPLVVARAVAAHLAERRAAAGALAVESAAEPSFEFDERGGVVGVAGEKQTESHRLIEQLMVLANEQVAGHLADRGQPALYRVHQSPDPPAVEALVEKLASLGIPTPPVPERMSPQQAGELVGKASQLVAQEVRRREGRGADARSHRSC